MRFLSEGHHRTGRLGEEGHAESGGHAREVWAGDVARR